MSTLEAVTRSVGARRRLAHIACVGGFGLFAPGVACSVDGRTVSVTAGASAGGSSGAGGIAQGGTQSPGGAGGEGAAPGAAGGTGGSAGGGNGGTSGSGAAAADAGIMPSTLAVCADEFFGDAATRQATTTGEAGDFSLTCAPGVSDDVSFHWIAPAAGYYAFDTLGSSFDTGLGLISPNCEVELACDDDAAAPQSELLRRFASGEEAVVVVDGKSGGFGDVVLNVNPITCPSVDADSQPLPLTSTTSDGDNGHTGACGGGGLREKAFRYQAPEPGLYRFSVSSDVISPALYVEKGPRCGGSLLGCNAGVDAASPAVVVRRLDADETVTLIADSASGAGAFSLDVEHLAGAECPNQAAITGSFDITATLEPDAPSLLTSSCVPERQVVLPGGTFPLPDHVYPVVLPPGYGCFLSFETSGPLAVSVLDGSTCAGSELVCQTLDTFNVMTDIEIDLGDAFAGTSFNYSIVVEASSPYQGPVTYTMVLGCFTV